MRYRSVSEPSLHGIVIPQRTAVWTQPTLITQCIELRPRQEGGQNHRADKETEMWVWVKNSLWDRRESEQFRLGRPEHVLKRFRRKREWGGTVWERERMGEGEWQGTSGKPLWKVPGTIAPPFTGQQRSSPMHAPFPPPTRYPHPPPSNKSTPASLSFSAALFFHKSVPTAKTTHINSTSDRPNATYHLQIMRKRVFNQKQTLWDAGITCKHTNTQCAWHLFTAPSVLLPGSEVHQTHPVTTGGHILSKLTRETRIHSLNAVRNAEKTGWQCISYS